MKIDKIGLRRDLQGGLSADAAICSVPHRPRVGMCSVTLRAQDPRDVIAQAVSAGLESMEWGSDVHVPSGDLALARLVGEQTRDAGLAVASYGSYFRFPWATPPGEQVQDILDTAVALGAPRIRVWAGPAGSAEAGAEERALTTRALGEFCRAASQLGLSTAFEFHSGTLTDTAASTRRLLSDLAEGNASTYWQPRVGASDLEVLEDLDFLGESVSTLHAFSWGVQLDRYSLSTREDMWRGVMHRAVKLPEVTDVLLEFLPEDDPALLAAEARYLREWVDDAVKRVLL
jgi:3-dehydroshikimate dehydratase